MYTSFEKYQLFLYSNFKFQQIFGFTFVKAENYIGHYQCNDNTRKIEPYPKTSNLEMDIKIPWIVLKEQIDQNRGNNPRIHPNVVYFLEKKANRNITKTGP